MTIFYLIKINDIKKVKIQIFKIDKNYIFNFLEKFDLQEFIFFGLLPHNQSLIPGKKHKRDRIR